MISIIVPVYNTEKYLCECVESVLAQTFDDWELIIVDDGSTDRSGTIADRYAAADRRIRVYHVDNGGLSCARNFAIAKCVGEYACFLDSDDMLHPAALKLLLHKIEQNKTDMVIACSHRGTSAQFKNSIKCHSNLLSALDVLESSLYQNGIILHSACGKLYKTKILKGVSFTERIYYEDLDYFYRICLLCNKITVCDADIYFYRQTPGSITNVWSDKRLDVLDVTDRIEAFIAENYPALLPAARDRKLSANFNMFILASANGRPEAASRCWQVIKEYRLGSLINRQVRLKNKAGILLSYLGRRTFARISRLI